MFEYVKIRDVGNGWEVWEQQVPRFTETNYRVRHKDAKAPILDGISRGWHHLVRSMTSMDIFRATQCAFHAKATGYEAREIMRAMIEHGVYERERAYQAGINAGIAREREENEVAASSEMQLLKQHVCDILGAEAASDPDCPSLAGWIRGTKRRATKGIFVTIGAVDAAFRDRAHEAMRRAGHMPRGTRDGVGRQVPHAIVVSPHRFLGNGANLSRDDLLLRHDVFEEALSRSGLTLAEGGLVQVEPERDYTGARP
jgi:hypothetical protein